MTTPQHHEHTHDAEADAYSEAHRELPEIADYHVQRATMWAHIADHQMIHGLNSDADRTLFAHNAHLAGLHAQIAATTAQLITSAAAEQFPDILKAQSGTTVVNNSQAAEVERTGPGEYVIADAANHLSQALRDRESLMVAELPQGAAYVPQEDWKPVGDLDHAPAFQDPADLVYNEANAERGGALDREEYADLYAAAAHLGTMHITTAPDMETRAELFNDGFDTAHRQGVGGDKSRVWLESKLTPILAELSYLGLTGGQLENIVTAIADEVLDNSLETEADSDPRPDQARGMYGKYFVERLHDPDGKHADDRFFVLDPLHDPYALSALREYVLTSQDEFPKLARDLKDWISELDGNED